MVRRVAIAETCCEHRVPASAPPVAQLSERMMPSNSPGDDIGIGGFSGDLTGRAGHIIYQEPPRELTIYWEMMVLKNQDGSQTFGVSVTCDFQYWSNPKGERISEERQLVLLRALRDWLHVQGKRSSIDRVLSAGVREIDRS